MCKVVKEAIAKRLYEFRAAEFSADWEKYPEWMKRYHYRQAEVLIPIFEKYSSEKSYIEGYEAGRTDGKNEVLDIWKRQVECGECFEKYGSRECLGH